MKKIERNKLFASLAYLNPSSLKALSDQILILVESKLWAKILIAMFLGAILGLLISATGPFQEFILLHTSAINTLTAWLVFPAQFFLKIVKMVIIPLIFSSIIRGLASTSDVVQMKKLGGKFALFVFLNSILAASLGVILTTAIGPGKGLSLRAVEQIKRGMVETSIFTFGPESILNMLPGNPLSSIVEGQMLDVVLLSMIIGVAIISINREQAKSAMDVLEVIQQICMTIISWAMKLAPVAVFGMMAQVTSSTGLKSLHNMAIYVLVCFMGFSLFIIFYALLVAVLKKEAPVTFLKKILTPLILAFSTSSSAVTMPVSMKCAEDDLGVDPEVARFLIPLGTTVNMAGSAIWHTTAVIFLGQAYDISLNLPEISIVVATSIASAIGSPGIPGVGIGILAAVLVKIGVPVEGVSLIMGVDRIVDMGCTAVNVAGDLTATKIFGDSTQKIKGIET